MKFRFLRLKEIPSTNTLASEHARHGESEGLVIVADHQTAGRGKPGRKWISPPGKNLLFSILLRPPIPPSRAPLLTQIACRSVAAVLKARGIDSKFKRPNDILVGGKKICGILVETGTSGGKLEYAVLGIGLNVNASAKELPPNSASLRQILGKKISRIDLAKTLLEEIERCYNRYSKKRFEKVADD